MATPADSAAVRAERAVEHAERLLAHTHVYADRLHQVARFFLFAAYMVLALINVWLWLLSGVVGLVHGLLRAVMLVVLWLSGGIAPPPGPRPAGLVDRARRNFRRLRLKGRIRRLQIQYRLAGTASSAGAGLRTFWSLTFERKLVVLLLVVFGVCLPALYLVPRPHYVLLTDDNAIQYQSGNVTYLIHAVDMFKPGHTREYINEDAWWLGKINSQGLKSRLQPGRFYRFWVVGIRWYYMPRLFPNIISEVEVDGQGHALTPRPTPADLAAASLADPSKASPAPASGASPPSSPPVPPVASPPSQVTPPPASTQTPAAAPPSAAPATSPSPAFSPSAVPPGTPGPSAAPAAGPTLPAAAPPKGPQPPSR